MVTELRGNLDGPYPMGEVHVYVAEDDLPSAKELLMADEVESAFEDPYESFELRRAPAVWIVVAALLALSAILFVRF